MGVIAACRIQATTVAKYEEAFEEAKKQEDVATRNLEQAQAAKAKAQEARTLAEGEQQMAEKEALEVRVATSPPLMSESGVLTLTSRCPPLSIIPHSHALCARVFDLF